MLAVFEKDGEGHVVRFERHLRHPVEKVWSALTVTENVVKWFPELIMDDVRQDGTIKFDMQDGSFEEMRITDYKPNAVLEFTWGEDLVRFELYPEAEGCLLLLKERIGKATDHTPKDIAGWHVCLDRLADSLNGEPKEFQKQEWEQWYEKYRKMLKQL